MVDARSVSSRVQFQALDSAPGLLAELGLPELEGNIDPGKLLRALDLEPDQARLSIDHLLNQLLLLYPVEQHIVKSTNIVGKKSRPGTGCQEKHRGRKRAAMLCPCTRVSPV